SNISCHKLSLHDALPIFNCVETAVRTAGSAIVEMHATEALAAVKELNRRAFRNRRLYITPIADAKPEPSSAKKAPIQGKALKRRSEEQKSELQSRSDLVC